MLEKSTYYILDASGNQLSMYEHEVDQQDVNYTLTERNIYGSSRLGRNSHKIDLYTADAENPVNAVLGEKYYELSNHLGNVLAVISDIKYPVSTGTTVDYFEVALVSVSDYSPFGVQLDGRTHQSSAYRYGFNGMESDDEVKGEGNSLDFGARIYDSRLGRWLSRDPKQGEYPHQSTYAFANNSPLMFMDPDGESGIVTIDKESKTLTISAHLTFYGDGADAALAKRTAQEIRDTWRDGDCHQVEIDGELYEVDFDITAEFKPELTPDEIAKNNDYKNNYIRVEESNGVGVSYYDSNGDGGNTGYFINKNLKEGSTTSSHEFGHGLGLIKGTHDGHPADSDIRGEGQPGIMYARGTLVDPEYQYDPKAAPGEKGGTLNPSKRKVTQNDIKLLELDKLEFDENGKAKIGSLTNKYHEKL